MTQPLTPYGAVPTGAAIARRRIALGTLGAFGTLGLAGLLGCGGGSDGSSGTTGSGGGTDTSGGSGTGTPQTCSVVPEETAGPYPADGSSASNANYNVLALSGIVREDIRKSIGATGNVDGVPLSISITLTGTRSGCAALAGYAVYLWHCSQEGNYSVYTERSIAANYLRGVQVTDAGGTVTFTTVVPGCYAGRMPHMHLEIYPSLALATTASQSVKTTQLAFPTDTLGAIYAAHSGYSASVRNLAAMSFATDNVFSDGTELQMTTMASDGSGGYTATAAISIAA
ncbi:intradiol ring-cleavage dioxygenase [Paracidovorax avenae]